MTAGPVWAQVLGGWTFGLFAVWVLAVCDGWLAGAGSARPKGPLAPARDALRSLFKESRRIQGADHFVWRAAPLLLVGVGGGMLAFGPFGAPSSHAMPAGLLAPLVALTIAGALHFMAGWAANSGYALLAAGRAVALMVGFLVPLALALAGLAATNQALHLQPLVETQYEGYWNVLLQPAGFVVYMLCSLFLAGWGPAKGPVSDDLAGGVELEMSGAIQVVWKLGRYLVLLGAAAFAVPLYFGGGDGQWLPAPVWSALKTLVLAAAMLTAHHLLPHFAVHRLLARAWMLLLPLALLNLGWALSLALVDPVIAGGGPYGSVR